MGRKLFDFRDSAPRYTGAREELRFVRISPALHYRKRAGSRNPSHRERDTSRHSCVYPKSDLPRASSVNSELPSEDHTKCQALRDPTRVRTHPAEGLRIIGVPFLVFILGQWHLNAATDLVLTITECCGSVVVAPLPTHFPLRFGNMSLVCLSPQPTTPGLSSDRSCRANPPDTFVLPEAVALRPLTLVPPTGNLAFPSVFERTPVEVFVEVFRHLDLGTAFNFAQTNKRFSSIFARYRRSIILPIVAREFSPLRGLLQVIKARPEDLSTSWGTWLDKRIRHNNAVLCEGASLPTEAHPDAVRPSSLEVVLDDFDLERILAVCKVVRGWERVFPQHRFAAHPSSTRSLLPHENHRLRRSLYVWMRYSFYFHGDLPRPNTSFPAGRDMRINQLRVLSNSELRELRDLWSTVQDIVRLKLCPSVAIVRSNAVGGTIDGPWRARRS